jgi:hypothetical protein
MEKNFPFEPRDGVGDARSPRIASPPMEIFFPFEPRNGVGDAFS